MNSNTKLFSAVSYLAWIGWLISFIFSEKDDRMVRHHLNQALVINIASTLGGILVRIGGIYGIAGDVISIAVVVFFIMGIVRALKLSAEPLPIIGDIHIID